jgi:hypothetical protein
VVAHTYNPRYSRGRDQEDLGLRPGGAKNVYKTPSQPMARCGGVSPSFHQVGSINRRIEVQAGLGINRHPISKTTSAKEWGAWLKQHSICLTRTRP